MAQTVEWNGMALQVLQVTRLFPAVHPLWLVQMAWSVRAFGKVAQQGGKTETKNYRLDKTNPEKA